MALHYAGLPAGDFVQSTPSNTWIINHNYGLPPICEVTNVGGQKMLPLRIYHSPDFLTTTITWSTPRAGTARVIRLLAPYAYAGDTSIGNVDTGAPAPQPWFLDTFSDRSGTSLAYHLANTGEGWVIDGGLGYNAYSFTMNDGSVGLASFIANTGSDQTYVPTPAQTSDFSFETRMKFAKVTGGGNDNTARLIVANMPDTANYFQLQLTTAGDGNGNGTIAFEGGDATATNSFGPVNIGDLPVDDYFTARVEVSNSSQTYSLFIDGVAAGSGTLPSGAGGTFNYIGLDGYNGANDPSLISVDYAGGWPNLTSTGKSSGLGFTIFRDEFSDTTGSVTGHTANLAPSGSSYVSNGVDFAHEVQTGLLVLATEATYSESILNFTATETHTPYTSQLMSLRGTPGSGDTGVPAQISYSVQSSGGTYYVTMTMKHDPDGVDSVKVDIATQSTATSQTYNLGANALSPSTEYRMWLVMDTTGVDVYLRNNSTFAGVPSGSTFLGRITAGSCTAIEFARVVFKSWNASTASDGFISAAYLATGGAETASTPYLALGLRCANLQYSYGVNAVDDLVATPINIAFIYGANVTVYNQKYIKFNGTGSSQSGNDLYSTYGTFACEFIIGGNVDAVGIYSCDEGNNPFDPEVFMGSALAQETSAFYHKSGYISFGLGQGQGTSIVNVAAAVDGDVIGVVMTGGWTTPSFYKNGVLLASGSFSTISGSEALIAAKQ